MSNDELEEDVFKELLKKIGYNNKKTKLIELLADLYNTTCDYCNVCEYGDTEKEDELQTKIEGLQKEVIKIAMKESL